MPSNDLPSNARELPRGLDPEDFDAISEAVQETPRGRWFLDEYAARLRQRETAGLLDSMKRLENAVSTNHEALMARLAEALKEDEPPAAHPLAGQAPQISARHMKYYRPDEDIFEPAPHAHISAVPNLTDRARELEAPRPDAQHKRRIVIIRHKPGDQIEVPLADEFARAS